MNKTYDREYRGKKENCKRQGSEFRAYLMWRRSNGTGRAVRVGHPLWAINVPQNKKTTPKDPQTRIGSSEMNMFAGTIVL